ncbi:hypothetical protein T06_6351, partial [Trichinella sp. T6]
LPRSLPPFQSGIPAVPITFNTKRMDYVNMREFPSSRSRCHSQIAFPTGSVFPCQTM